MQVDVDTVWIHGFSWYLSIDKISHTLLTCYVQYNKVNNVIHIQKHDGGISFLSDSSSGVGTNDECESLLRNLLFVVHYPWSSAAGA